MYISLTMMSKNFICI